MDYLQYPQGTRVINTFLSPKECSNLIHHAETIGFDEAPINTLGGATVVQSVRNNKRVMFDDVSYATELFKRAYTAFHQEFEGWGLSSLNERFRIYRYRQHQYFKWHRDGSYVRELTNASKFTFMIYLNDGFEGGTTDFLNFSITPKTGLALIFPHFLKHQGAQITQGVKYVLRTDVMYQI